MGALFQPSDIPSTSSETLKRASERAYLSISSHPYDGVLHVSEITREGETVLNISPRYVRSSGLTHDIEGYELDDRYPFCRSKRD
jgi:predicted Zn-ribbon and HTH transcriptional regulator